MQYQGPGQASTPYVAPAEGYRTPGGVGEPPGSYRQQQFSGRLPHMHLPGKALPGKFQNWNLPPHRPEVLQPYGYPPGATLGNITPGFAQPPPGAYRQALINRQQSPSIGQQPMQLNPGPSMVYRSSNQVNHHHHHLPSAHPGVRHFYPHQQASNGQMYRLQEHRGRPSHCSNWRNHTQGERTSLGGELDYTPGADWMIRQQLTPGRPNLEFDREVITVSIPGDLMVIRGKIIVLDKSLTFGQFYDLLHTHNWYEPEAEAEHNIILDFLKTAPTEMLRLFRQFESFYKGSAHVYPLRLHE